MAKSDNRHSMAWAILYPESMNPNYKDILSSYQVCFAISPLHEHDVSADGKPKKPHYHVVLDYSDVKQKKSREQFTTIFNSIGAVCSPLDHEFFCVNRRLTYRYLMHLDDANKYLYDYNDLFVHGFDGNVFDLIFSSADPRPIINEMCSFIISQKFCYFFDFAAYCSHEEPEWHLYILKHKSYFIEYIKSFAFFLRSINEPMQLVYVDYLGGLPLNL